ncbi:MAG: DUF6125 family protein [Candidatus Methanomethylicaceae archaeon]|nr:DUF6125 family protein [Candidatus Verstraetearchaeota archaeon]
MIEELSKEELIELIKIFSKNLLTLDGYWFLSIEDKYGLEKAIEIDKEVWEKFGISEARRIKKFLNINEGNLNDLEKSLRFLSYATISDSLIEKKDNKIIFSIRNCRPQIARINSGKGIFPCKEVGLAHLSSFAKTINSKFKVKCIVCPPDERSSNIWCSWEFYLE